MCLPYARRPVAAQPILTVAIIQLTQYVKLCDLLQNELLREEHDLALTRMRLIQKDSKKY
jgi:hypothetical protein